MRRVLPPRIGAVVLGYHRLVSPADALGGDPWRMCVTPAHFAEHVAFLAEHARPVSLRHLVAALAADVPVRGMVAVTFDDGYQDVLSAALPVLERFRVPATVFLVTELGASAPWWDRLTALIAGVDPTIPLRVPTGRSEFVWPGVGGAEQLRIRLHRALRRLAPDERDATLVRLSRAWGRGSPDSLPVLLTDEEARGLAASPLITVGSHSATHPPLAEISPKRADGEIRSSRARLENRLGRSIDLFSYPHGSHDSRTRRFVREAGYAAAVTSERDSVQRGVDRYALPRVWVPDEGVRAFRRRILRYAGPLTKRR